MTDEMPGGWFADWDDQTETPGWQPCFDTGEGHIPCFQVWFVTKADCEKWMAEHVIGATWAGGEPTDYPPGSPD